MLLLKKMGTRSLIFSVAVLMIGCREETQPVKPVIPDEKIVTVPDPLTPPTIGFFLDTWQPKSFEFPAYTDVAAPGSASVVVTVDASSIVTKIPPGIFAHNANTWMGELSATGIADLKRLNPRLLRFPGGNLSNNYFWNASQDSPPSQVPATLLDKDGKVTLASWVYGKTNTNWELTLDKYYDLLAKTDSKGIISVNCSYARYGTSSDPVATAAHLAADWVRYDNGRTNYWEIGNEHNGDWQAGYRIDLSKNKDGQPEFITGELYGKHVQVFVDSMKKAANQIGKTIFIGAVAQEAVPESWQTSTVKTWNAGLFRVVGNKADFYSVHSYFTPYDQNSNATVVLNAALSEGSKVMNFFKQEMQTLGAVIKPVALTEWNMWAKDSKQQVSNTSGLFAVLVQAEAIRNQYGMAARWDLLNGWDNGNDHGLFSNGDEGGGVVKWTPRPSFYHMYFFQKLLGDRMVPASVTGGSAIKAYGSTFSSGESNVTLINTSSAAQTAEIRFKNFNPGLRYYWYTLEGSNDNGEFSRKVSVNGSTTTQTAGGPSDYLTIKARSALTSNGVRVTVPALSAVYMVVAKP